MRQLFSNVTKNNSPRDVSLKQREARLAYIMVAPTLVIITVIILFPMVWNVVLSFQPIRMKDLADINLLDFSQLSLGNYEESLGRRFWTGLKITLIFTVFSTILMIIVGLWAALVAREKFPGRNLFRAFLLFPYVSPLVSSALVWRFMLDKHIGIVNVLWEGLGNEAVSWLTVRQAPVSILGMKINLPVALIVLIVFEVWRYFPFAYLFLLSRMQAIPEDLYDAAKVDGASPSQRLWYITLPQLKTVIGTLFLIRFIWSFFKFNDVFLLTGGSSGTEVLSIQIYNWLYARRNVGVAAAIGVLLAIFLLFLATLYQRWFESREE